MSDIYFIAVTAGQVFAAFVIVVILLMLAVAGGVWAGRAGPPPRRRTLRQVRRKRPHYVPAHPDRVFEPASARVYEGPTVDLSEARREVPV